MNTATGTINENLSDDERADRWRGMKLVAGRPSRPSSKPFRIGMSQNLADSFQDSENTSARAKDAKRPSGSNDLEKENVSANVGRTDARSIPVAITLTAVALTGVLIGFLLTRGRTPTNSCEKVI